MYLTNENDNYETHVPMEIQKVFDTTF